jgi:hypothetical protein
MVMVPAQMTIEAPQFDAAPFAREEEHGPNAISRSRPGSVLLRVFSMSESETGPRVNWNDRRTARLFMDQIGRIAVTPPDTMIEFTWRIRKEEAGEHESGSLRWGPADADGSVVLSIDDGTGPELDITVEAHKLFVLKHLMFSAIPHIAGLGSVFETPSLSKSSSNRSGGGGGFSME